MTKVININTLSPADQILLYAGRLENHVYIGRGKSANLGRWGNKYTHLNSVLPDVVHVRSRNEAITRHRADVLADPELMRKIRTELKGKVLVCWCAPLACHGHTYACIADGLMGLPGRPDLPGLK